MRCRSRERLRRAGAGPAANAGPAVMVPTDMRYCAAAACIALTMSSGVPLPANRLTMPSFMAPAMLAPYEVSSQSCTYDALFLPLSTSTRFGSVTPDSEPLVTGRPAPLAPNFFCTSTLTMYLSNSTHSGGAFLEQANPSPPPRAAVGSPADPGTPGKLNQPRKGGTFLSAVRPLITPGSQCPMSSMAALPLATRPAELPAPV